MESLISILSETWALYLEAAPWLIVGILAAGAVHVWVPDGLLGRWLGGKGVWPVVKSAFVGAPLPLCSCGVLPAAVGLRRDGASKASTVSFLIATPETGPDSVAVSYALLGPVMAIVRPIAAVTSAIVAGVLTLVFVREEGGGAPVQPQSTCSSKSCCSGDSCSTSAPAPKNSVLFAITYGFTDILDDIALWLAIGLGVAGVMSALVEPMALANWGSGWLAMGAMIVFGVPLYVCATASTPIAAGLMAVGVSPGATLVFLLVGPATNIATLGVVAKELGRGALAAYVLGIIASAVGLGLGLDALVEAFKIDVGGQMTQAAETIPEAVKWVSGIVLAPFFVRSLGLALRKR